MNIPKIETFSALTDYHKSAMAMLTFDALLACFRSKLPVASASLLDTSFAIASLIIISWGMTILGAKWWCRFVFVRRGARIGRFVSLFLARAKATSLSRANNVKAASLQRNFDHPPQRTAVPGLSKFAPSNAESCASAAQMNFIRFTILSAM